MATTITLPDDLEARLRQAAIEQHRSIEAVVLDTLATAFQVEPDSTVDSVVARIKDAPSELRDVRPAQGSLADLLRQPLPNTEFELDAWSQQWSAVEDELHSMTQADDHAEGRG